MTKSPTSRTIDAKREIPIIAATRGPSTTNVLDLQELCDRCLGNLDLVERVLDKFDQRLPGELAELEHVLKTGDAAKVTLVAHRIKGNASNISASGLQEAAAEIEDLSRAGRVADIPARLPKLREQWQRYLCCRATIQPKAAEASGHGSASTLTAALVIEEDS